jgi:hypothetical protein
MQKVDGYDEGGSKPLKRKQLEKYCHTWKETPTEKNDM